MKYKKGDKYFREFILEEDDIENYVEGGCLSGDVIYADDEVFIIGPPTGDVIIDPYCLSLAQCKSHYPKLDFDFDRAANPHVDNFIPMKQETEEFLFFDGMSIDDGWGA